MTDPPRPRSEREQTDESPHRERDRADRALDDEVSEADETADAVISRARARADALRMTFACSIGALTTPSRVLSPNSAANRINPP